MSHTVIIRIWMRYELHYRFRRAHFANGGRIWESAVVRMHASDMCCILMRFNDPSVVLGGFFLLLLRIVGRWKLDREKERSSENDYKTLIHSTANSICFSLPDWKLIFMRRLNGNEFRYISNLHESIFTVALSLSSRSFSFISFAHHVRNSADFFPDYSLFFHVNVHLLSGWFIEPFIARIIQMHSISRASAVQIH